MAITPGTYLRLRREAAGLSIQDVARKMYSEPRLPELARVGWLYLVEADEQPCGEVTVRALAGAFAFDPQVLDRLADLHYYHAKLPEPRLCRICACSEFDPCDEGGQGCAWAEPDLCTACALPDPDDDPDGDDDRGADRDVDDGQDGTVNDSRKIAA